MFLIEMQRTWSPVLNISQPFMLNIKQFWIWFKTIPNSN